ncbi:MAG: hypothetical protein HQM13_14310 [SAR324 cluster bacterium]|nr:hypothetical protein [SAR324 cluster bacterium]
MFLNQFNHSQKLAFLKLAKHVARVDDAKIDSFEMETLSLMSKEMEIAVHEVDDMAYDFDKLYEKFDDSASKNICLIELIEVAFSNGNFHLNQSRFIESLARDFGFDAAHVKNLKEWVSSMLGLFKSAEKLINKKVTYRKVRVTSLF